MLPAITFYGQKMLLLAVAYYSGINGGVITNITTKIVNLFWPPLYLGHMNVRVFFTEVTLLESALTHKVCRTIDEFIEEN